MPTKIQLRRDTAADWTSNNPTLAAGEFGYETDTTKFKIGDGSTAWNSLAYNTNTDGITIDDNEITTNRSNDDLVLTANGTGQIQISPNGASVDDVFSDNTRYNFGANRIYSEQNADANSIFSDSGDRRYANGDFVSVSLSSSSSNGHARWRSGTFSLIDMKGYDIDSSAAYFKGINTRYVESNAKNTSTSTASTLNNISGVYSSINTAGTDSGAGLTIDSAYGFVSDIFLSEGSGETVALTDAYHFATKGSGGGGSVTDEYGFYVDGLGGTNNYAFYSNSDTYKSRVGSLERYREEINTLTSSSTITVDCSLAPVHKVTLASNTEFNISNLGTGQSVTLIITQDSGGSNTATFGTDGSTAVKFAGGTPTLSTAASAIDIVTIFNDGTNFYGNIAKAYA